MEEARASFLVEVERYRYGKFKLGTLGPFEWREREKALHYGQFADRSNAKNVVEGQRAEPSTPLPDSPSG